jgi:dolichyl-phosphate-mannose--protein O-mannosyl transferase
MRLISWLQERIWLISLTLIGLFFRLWHLAQPKGLIFDELYYVQNAHSLLHHGVDINSKGAPDFIVHPPVGKWLIAGGIKLFGYNEFGWRFAAAIIGTASIALMYLTVEKLFANKFLSITATILMLSDGLHLVHSRVSVLDIFLMFFIQLAFYFVITHQHWWAGLAFGLALGTKWSGLYPLAAFALLAVALDLRTHKLVKMLPSRLLQYGLLPIITYIASWAGWFATSIGFDRQLGAIAGFIDYHKRILTFHASLQDPHTYSANPFTWLLQSRPTAFYYETPTGCGAPKCSQEILALGTPLLWWIGTISIAIALGFFIAKREWRAGFILLGLGSSYLPWFAFQKRTMFNFYAISFEPFLIMAIVYVLYKYLMSAENDQQLRIRKRIIIAGVVIVVANFFYFLPVFTGTPIPYETWLNRMWLNSWI